MNGSESAENAVARHSLLAELDARQDEVLAALDALNDRIEAALRDAIPHDKLAEDSAAKSAELEIVELPAAVKHLPIKKAA
ncbi:hypothetical protein ETAA8_56590 [Anatilimnocola aggregata]|uniref:Uncharacterized protein n=1 Tax=Anatilimnocola aggregata TaxID=2528021 RepID=A0A517YJV9_9BACT|nr:hypothetical protein [Anatilimnocola aggregata]QDU30514.1 hypothetical protein ETAA8_56590 [Anatilimnocola aggregata]